MKKKFYLTLDTETCTLPFADTLCKTPREKQKIAIAKPLIYDIGWVITDSTGAIIKKENYLVQETFFVPNVFNTAYYKAKRPIYMEKLAKGEIEVDIWDNIANKLKIDMDFCNVTCAYNICFDCKKAIPFTEKYIKALYSADYTKWEEMQKKNCEKIIKGADESENPSYLIPTFDFRGKTYEITDLWGIACTKLINIDKYRKYCLDNDLLTNSRQYFKTSAETSFQYLLKEYDFIEEHTALSDSIIESQILTKALKKGKLDTVIIPFPFKELGTTMDFVTSDKGKKYKADLIDKLQEYLDTECKEGTTYYTKIENIIDSLKV